MNLYDLVGNYKKVYEMDLDDETWQDTLESIDSAIEQKADGVMYVIRNLEVDVIGLKDEEARLKKKREVAERKIKRLKQYLQDNMETVGKTKFKTQLFSYNIQNNPASLKLTDEKLIPQKYYTVETSRKYDNKAIKDDLKAGKVINGAELKTSQSLRIR